MSLDNKDDNCEQVTDKAPQGFAAHPENINRGGRPKGSRNKTTLIKAQLQLDDSTEAAAALLDAIMRGDKEYLNMKDDIPLVLRHKAALDILNKAIANEKDKTPAGGTPEEDIEEKGGGEKKPLFSKTAVS